MTPIAEAFSRHAFSEVYPHLADDVRWRLIGAADVEGRDAVIAACEESLPHLAALKTEFTEFRARGGPDFAVVDSTATYTDPDGATSQVASCDLFTFTGGKLTEIVSYTVELPP
ncbi:nuclear transport factor 2 family protein [Actinoplanes sp. NPDC051470]|uniref:nuclear transport factor 2 family protein n=1 Tax=unclassified Actinoplanes TaxID=2626549 RepID=UPI0034406888